MSEERTFQHIQQDYTQAMARVGEIDYLTQDSFPLERSELVKKIRKLEHENRQFQKKQQQEQKPEQKDKSTESVSPPPETSQEPKTEEQIEKALDKTNA